MSLDELDYDSIYREYAPKVLALARRKLLGRAVAEDVVQEVFIRAYTALPNLDLDRPIWPWLRRVTVNVCTDVLRSPRTWAEEPSDLTAESLAGALAAPPGVDPVSTVLADEQRQAIKDALDRLAPRQREILLRRVVDGTSSEEMAAGEESSVEAVKSAVKRGRHAFRQAYNDIAGKRGLLGGQPPVAVSPDGLWLRLRGAVNACARVCNESPWWQSVPVAVAAAVVALGLNAGSHRGGAEVALPAGPGGLGGGSAAALAGAHAAGAAGFTRSSATATPPGGGAPPAPSPGSGGGAQGQQLAKVDAGASWQGDPNDTLFIGVRNTNPPGVPGDTGNNYAGYFITMNCSRSERHRRNCDAANVLVESSPDPVVIEWRPVT